MTKFLVLDTETGGIDPATHSLLSVGLVVWDAGELTAQLEILLAEDLPVTSPEAMAINRIEIDQHMARAVAPKVAVEQIERFVATHFADVLEAGAKVVLAGHNVGFDVGFLKRLYRLADVPFDLQFSHRSVDTASIMRFLHLCGLAPEAATTSDGAFAFLKVAPEAAERHTALADARATARLLGAAIRLVQENNLRGAAA